jgi:hypothetical protein
MIALGALVTFLGFLISLFSLSLTTSPYGRLAVVALGILISLFGIIGILNRYYLKTAIWRK